MKPLREDFEVDAFFERVGRAEERVLFLDYDGTLAPLQADWQNATPWPGIQGRLNDIVQGPSRLVMVSGRTVRELVEFLRLRELPEIYGSHGLERLTPDGEYEVVERDAAAIEAFDAADRWAIAQGFAKLWEVKPAGRALHWRGLPSPLVSEMKSRARQRFSMLADEAGLHMHEFGGSMELRVAGAGKGHAVREALAARPSAACAYLGDDLVDEDAFRAVDGQGAGVLVHDDLRPTSAHLWVQPPEGVLEFLDQWRRACDAG